MSLWVILRALPGDSPRFDLYDGQREFPISAKRRRFTMKEYQSLSHTRWDCKYHVVFIPKRRKKRIFGALRRQLSFSRSLTQSSDTRSGRAMTQG